MVRNPTTPPPPPPTNYTSKEVTEEVDRPPHFENCSAGPEAKFIFSVSQVHSFLTAIPDFVSQAFWVKPSPILGSVYQVGRFPGADIDSYPFVLFVLVCSYSVHSTCKSVLPISTSKTSEQG